MSGKLLGVVSFVTNTVIIQGNRSQPYSSYYQKPANTRESWQGKSATSHTIGVRWQQALSQSMTTRSPCDFALTISMTYWRSLIAPESHQILMGLMMTLFKLPAMQLSRLQISTDGTTSSQYTGLQALGQHNWSTGDFGLLGSGSVLVYMKAGKRDYIITAWCWTTVWLKVSLALVYFFVRFPKAPYLLLLLTGDWHATETNKIGKY